MGGMSLVTRLPAVIHPRYALWAGVGLGCAAGIGLSLVRLKFVHYGEDTIRSRDLALSLCILYYLALGFGYGSAMIVGRLFDAIVRRGQGPHL